MLKITKEVTFDCAHMLSGHKGLCANLHGHTYKLQITLEGEAVTDMENSSNEMIIDFQDLKQAIQESVLEQFDHAIIFSAPLYRNGAEKAIYQVVEAHGLKHLILPSRTTAESMAKYIQKRLIKNQLLACAPIKNISVKLWETPTSFVEV